MSINALNEFIFTWKIVNYSYCPQTLGEEIESPPFTAESISGCKWVLLIYPKGEFYENFVRCVLKRIDPDDTLDQMEIDYTVEVLRDDGTVLLSKPTLKATLQRLSDNNGYGWLDFIEIDYLANEMKNWSDDILTLRCRMVCEKERLENEAVGCEVATQVGVNLGTFTWDVWSPSQEHWSDFIILPVSGIDEFDITLTVPEEDVMICIRCVNKSASLSRMVKFELTFLSRSGMFIGSNKESHLFQSENQPWNFPIFMKKEKLKMNTSGLMFYDFILKGKVTTSNGLTIHGEPCYSYSFKTFPNLEVSTFDNIDTTMQNNFRDLFISKKHSDVKLQAGEGEFQAHRSVLAARSPVFSAMFEQDLSESKTGIVEIHDVDSEILSKFLDYIYTDTIDKMDYEIAKNLFLIADKYEVLSLKKRCAAFLMSVLERDNACDVAIVADMVNHDPLKMSAINIIKENASKILPSSDWLRLIKINAELATEILIIFSKDYASVRKTI